MKWLILACRPWGAIGPEEADYLSRMEYVFRCSPLRRSCDPDDRDGPGSSSVRPQYPGTEPGGQMSGRRRGQCLGMYIVAELWFVSHFHITVDTQTNKSFFHDTYWTCIMDAIGASWLDIWYLGLKFPYIYYKKKLRIFLFNIWI